MELREARESTDRRGSQGQSWSCFSRRDTYCLLAEAPLFSTRQCDSGSDIRRTGTCRTGETTEGVHLELPQLPPTSRTDHCTASLTDGAIARPWLAKDGPSPGFNLRLADTQSRHLDVFHGCRRSRTSSAVVTLPVYFDAASLEECRSRHRFSQAKLSPVRLYQACERSC